MNLVILFLADSAVGKPRAMYEIGATYKTATIADRSKLGQYPLSANNQAMPQLCCQYPTEEIVLQPKLAFLLEG